MCVETDADEAEERATVQNSQDNARLVGCNSARGMGVLRQCRIAQRGVQRCEMQGVVAATQRSKREHLSATEGASASVGDSSLTGRSDWEISYLLLSN